MTGIAYMCAFLQRSQVRHAERLPVPLAKRVLEAARFRAVLAGSVAADQPCLATLLPVGGPRGAPGGSRDGHPYFVEGLRARIEAESASFERELDVAALRPWAVARAAVLTKAEVLEAEEPFELLVAASNDGGTGDTEESNERSAPGATGSRSAWRSLLPPLSVAGRSNGADGFAPSHPGVDRADRVRVLMSERVLEDNLEHCRLDAENERAGVFVGRLLEDEARVPVLQIDHFVPALETEATGASVRFGRATWAGINRHIASLDGNMTVQGFSHSHPPEAVAHTSASSPLFMSYDDIAVMAGHFNAPYHLAAVVDPTDQSELSSAIAFFGWSATGVALEHRSVDVTAVAPSSN